MKNEEVLHREKDTRFILNAIKRRKDNWIGQILRMNCRLKELLKENRSKDRSDGAEKEGNVSSYRMPLRKGNDAEN